MRDWEIGVLAAIVVVFLVFVTFYVVLLVRGLRLGNSRLLGLSTFNWFVGDLVAASNELYFYDFQRKLRCINISSFQSSEQLFASIIQQGFAAGVSSASCIGLSRVNENNVLIELDFDKFFLMAPQDRQKAAAYTAVDPLVLSHHFPTVIATQSALRSPAGHASPPRPPVPRPGSQALLPRAIILPLIPVIGTKKPIILSAVAFVLASNPTTEFVGLDDKKISQLEFGWLAGDATKDLGDGVTATFVPNSDNINVTAASGEVVALVRKAFTNVVIKYSIGNGEWKEYEKPFTLPLGRCSVRMEVLQAQGDVPLRSASAVYSVQPE